MANYVLEKTAIQVSEALTKAVTAVQRLVFNNVAVETSLWVEDTTIDDYPFRAQIQLNGVSESDIPDIRFSSNDRFSGMFSDQADSYDGGVYIYAKDIPANIILIPKIYLWKE